MTGAPGRCVLQARVRGLCEKHSNEWLSVASLSSVNSAIHSQETAAARAPAKGSPMGALVTPQEERRMRHICSPHCATTVTLGGTPGSDHRLSLRIDSLGRAHTRRSHCIATLEDGYDVPSSDRRRRVGTWKERHQSYKANDSGAGRLRLKRTKGPAR